MDILYVLFLLTNFALTAALVLGCARLGGRP